MNSERSSQQWLFPVCTAVVLALLCIRYFWPLFAFNTPIGYDTGIYRYLFIQHAKAWPPFTLGPVEEWAKGHPMGLFMFTSMFLKMGMPVDWLIGWLWNFTCVFVLALLAFTSGKKFGRWVGLATLVAALLGIATYDGFSSMYWKTVVALGWMVLSIFLLDKRSAWWVLPAVLCFMTHNQTGLLLTLTVGTWWLLELPREWKNPKWRYGSLLAFGAGIIAVLSYIPVWNEAVAPHLRTLFTTQGNEALGGAFPGALFYLRTEGILLALGVVGLCYSIYRKKTVGPWELPVLWAGVFVIFQLFFYRRFFQHLEFFLLPFVGVAIVAFWNKFPVWGKIGIMAALLVQAVLSLQVAQLRTPSIDAETFALLEEMSTTTDLPADAFLIAAENQSPTWFAGWLPQYRVAGPGLFSLPWPESDWEQLLYGTHEQRRMILGRLPEHSYFIITPIFREHYKEFAQGFLEDSCMHPVEGTALLEIRCPAL